MDDKVKLTLITTVLLLVIIIAAGLYSTFNPKDNTAVSTVNFTQVKDPEGNPIVGIGSKAKTSIKKNSYFFPRQNKQRKIVDPGEDLDAPVESVVDDFFDPKKKQAQAAEQEFGADYVQIDEDIADETNTTLEDMLREEAM